MADEERAGREDATAAVMKMQDIITSVRDDMVEAQLASDECVATQRSYSAHFKSSHAEACMLDSWQTPVFDPDRLHAHGPPCTLFKRNLCCLHPRS